MFDIKAKEQPKWYNFRWRLSSMFVKIAKKIYPKNPEVTTFWMKVIQDDMIYGKSIIRIEPEKFEKAT